MTKLIKVDLICVIAGDDVTNLGLGCGIFGHMVLAAAHEHNYVLLAALTREK